MNILTQEIVYTLSSFGLTLTIIMTIVAALCFIISIEFNEPKIIIISFISFIFLVIMGIYDSNSHPTLINKPNKIQYTVEIVDNNIWKEIATNYIIKEKPFEEKEIYIIEGDYNNDNNN